MDFCSASSLKQQSAGRHVAPLRHIILIPSQQVFGLTRLGLQPMIYHTGGEHANHYTTDAVCKNWIFFLILNNFKILKKNLILIFHVSKHINQIFFSLEKNNPGLKEKPYKKKKDYNT